MTSLLRKKGKGKEKAQSSEAPRFKSPFHEAHFKGKLSARKVLPEVPIDLNDDILSPNPIQIRMRKWEKFTAPLQAVSHNLVKEFYANAWEPDKAKRKPYTYTTMVQGTDISFAPRDIKRIYRRLDQQQEENRKSFEAINTRMDHMDDQLSFLCYSNQMVNETMYYPYQNIARQFREMEAQGVPVTIANLAIHRHREEEMNRERIRHNQTVQEAASQRAREANKGKAREVVPDSEEEESEEMYSSPSEEW
ncbi:hypothetical protein PIB30_083611 [Stylosanthes scabra]|uniref:Putative plant transposon protein domain-containing protein n=1 Tax=Stylosanthes scabra TaxID=79078 RepID=A0ABU6RTH9_9FABA|nr:hypothetical protein [Stylosanthes scabra]